MNDKLHDIQVTMERLWGHFAVAKEERNKIRLAGYKDGYDAGYRSGRERGFVEGFEEGKVFISHNNKDPLT